MGKLWYWFVGKFFRKYHVLKLHGPSYDTYGYADVTSRLIYANFNLLVDFIDNEADVINWDSDPVHRAARDKMQELYDWYTDPATAQFLAYHDTHEIINEKLHELIDLRCFLWS